MGKGRIIATHGEGRYTLEILEDRARAESNRAMAMQRLEELDQRITEAEAEIPALQQAVDDAAQAQDAAIALHQQQLDEDGESDVDLAAFAVAVMEAAANRDRKRIEVGSMKADRLSLQTRIERIDALPPLRQVETWCADYTEDLEGDVATAEVPGEVGQVIIKPGFEGASQWSATTDGSIQPALSGTPAGVFYNLAMLPGWQKWRPTFRIATISNIVNDTCDISLIPAASSQQGLNVNAQGSYSGVPIMYMDCNGAAFESADRVLVAFSGDAEAPVVVGFEKEPRECVAQIWIAFLRDSWAYGETWTEHDEGVYTQLYSPASGQSGVRGAFAGWIDDNANFGNILGGLAAEWAAHCLVASLGANLSYIAPDDSSSIRLHDSGRRDVTELTAQDFEAAVRVAVPDAGPRHRILFLFNNSPPSGITDQGEFNRITAAVQTFVDEHGDEYAGVEARMVVTNNANWPGYGARWVRWLTPEDASVRMSSFSPAAEVDFSFSKTW